MIRNYLLGLGVIALALVGLNTTIDTAMTWAEHALIPDIVRFFWRG